MKSRQTNRQYAHAPQEARACLYSVKWILHEDGVVAFGAGGQSVTGAPISLQCGVHTARLSRRPMSARRSRCRASLPAFQNRVMRLLAELVGR